MMLNNQYKGQVFGGYKLLKQIAEDEGSQIYLAQSTSVEGRQVAVKFLTGISSISLLNEGQFREKFRGLLELKDEYILPLIDAGIERRQPYLVMEYVTGGSLRQRLERGGSSTFSSNEALALIAHIGQALDHAHRQGIVHGNLEPENIVFDANDRPLLTNFDVSSFLDVASQRFPAENLSHYFSPEQSIQDVKTSSGDQYALASIAYELLTGRAPFAEFDPLLRLILLTREPTAPRRVNASVSLHVERALLKALAKKPSDRYETTAEFVSALRAAPRLTVYVYDQDEVEASSENVAALAKKQTEPMATSPLLLEKAEERTRPVIASALLLPELEEVVGAPESSTESTEALIQPIEYPVLPVDVEKPIGSSESSAPLTEEPIELMLAPILPLSKPDVFIDHSPSLNDSLDAKHGLQAGSPTAFFKKNNKLVTRRFSLVLLLVLLLVFVSTFLIFKDFEPHRDQMMIKTGTQLAIQKQVTSLSVSPSAVHTPSPTQKAVATSLASVRTQSVVAANASSNPPALTATVAAINLKARSSGTGATAASTVGAVNPVGSAAPVNPVAPAHTAVPVPPVAPAPSPANPPQGQAPVSASAYLNGSVSSSPQAVNLTSEGSMDWAAWGYNGQSSLSHKSGGGSRISGSSRIGGSSTEVSCDNFVTFSWSDGSPTSSVGSETCNEWTYVQGNGFQFTVQGSTQMRTLRVYVGIGSAQGLFTATCSDGKGGTLWYKDTSVTNYSDQANGLYTLYYRTASPDQPLTITFTISNVQNNAGSINLEAVTLQ